MATHSSVLAWRIPWTEEPGGLQSMGSQRVGHGWATNAFTSGDEDSGSENVPRKAVSPALAWGWTGAAARQTCVQSPSSCSRKRKHWSRCSYSSWGRWKERAWRNGSHPPGSPRPCSSRVVTRSLEKPWSWPMGLQLPCTARKERAGVWHLRLVPMRGPSAADRPQAWHLPASSTGSAAYRLCGCGQLGSLTKPPFWRLWNEDSDSPQLPDLVWEFNASDYAHQVWSIDGGYCHCCCACHEY